MPRPLRNLVRASSVIATLWCFVLALALGGCDGPATTDPPDPDPDAGPRPCVPGELTREDGTCQPAGLPPDMPCPPGEWLREDGVTCQPAGLPPDMPCPPGELLLDDGITCQKAGVPASECGEGFLPDGKDGCEPILPADPCPEGLMAVPGDTECHEVAPCGSGTWGDIPVEANTEFVDQAYVGGDSDGTQAKPWTSIQEGFYAAAKGAIVAVAAGSYPEDVLIKGKPVRLWGRCPAMVEVVGTGAQFGAIVVLKNAGGAEIRGVAVTGAELGIGVSGSSDVVIDRVWIHGMGQVGVNVQDDLGPTSVLLKGSLIEQNHETGVLVLGAGATMEATVVRSTLPSASGVGGGGLRVEDRPATGARANVTVRACLFEQNRDAGVYIGGSDATIEATVVRSTLPDAQGNYGRGITVEDDLATKERANVTVRACLFEQNRDVGVYIGGSDATIEATVVRSTLPDAQGGFGHGISAQRYAKVTIRACLVEQNHELGVGVTASDTTIEATVVRSNLPGASGSFGRGINVQGDLDTSKRASLTVRACLVEQNHDVGVFVVGSDATIEATVIRATLPDAQEGGHGISIQDDQDTTARANVTVHACLIEQSRELGMFVGGSDATIEATVVRSTLPGGQGKAGRGIEINDDRITKARANVTLRACLVEQNHDVGVAVLGSDATIEGTVVRSTLPDVQGEAGWGIDIESTQDTKARANVTLRACLIEQNQDLGVAVLGSDATIESTVVRSTLPNARGSGGRGINIQSNPGTNERSNATVHACVVEQNQELGVAVFNSDATIEATVVSSTLPDASGKGGRGINIHTDADTNERSDVTVHACLIAQNQDVGVFVSASDVTIDASVVRDTAPQSDDTFGDGITVLEADVMILSTEVIRNARAGIASFGGQVTITDGVITCNGFDLEGEPFDNTSFSFDGSTGWQCSGKAPAECTELGECHVETVGLTAPAKLPAVDPPPQ